MPAKRFIVQLEREYVDWVEEAKRPETRARRIAATVERVRERRPQR